MKQLAPPLFWRVGLGTVILLFLLFHFSCSNPLTDSGSGSVETGGDTADSGGNVRLSIPRYAPWLLFAVEDAEETDSSPFASKSIATPQPRAYMVADEVVVTVWDDQEPATLVKTETFTPQSFNPDPVVCSLNLIADNTYTVDVEIYNLDVSDTQPVVAGRYEDFTVVDGVINDVSITCVPAAPELINLDDPAVDLSMITTQLDQDGYPTEAGGEVWVSFTAPANGAVILPLTLPADTMLGLQFFDSQGLPLEGEEPFLVEESGSGHLTDLSPGETYYMAMGLVAESRIEQSFSMEVQSAEIITGTLSLPGYTDPSIVSDMGGIILDSTLSIPIPDLDFDFTGDLSDPTVTAGGLEWTYTLVYDGGPYTGYLYSGFINDLGNWPASGDIFGAYDGDPDTDPDYSTGDGIEAADFTGTMSGVDFEFELIGADPVPVAAFPDAALQTAMEELIGKEFTGVAGGVTYADLSALTEINISGRYDSYNDLTGLDLCDNVYELSISENDLSSCDLTEGGTTATVLENMDNLSWLNIGWCELYSIDFLSGLSQLHGLSITWNIDLDINDFAVITPTNYPNLQYLYLSNWDRDGDGEVEPDDAVSEADWDSLRSLLRGFTDLRSLELSSFYAGDANFAELFSSGEVLDLNSGNLTSLMVGQNELSNASLSHIASLSALEYLQLHSTPAITDISSMSGMYSLEFLNIAGTRPQSLSVLQSLYDNGAFQNHFDYSDIDIDLRYCDLDLWEGTPDRAVVDYLESNGVRVHWNEGNNLTQGSGDLDLTIQ